MKSVQWNERSETLRKSWVMKLARRTATEDQKRNSGVVGKLGGWNDGQGLACKEAGSYDELTEGQRQEATRGESVQAGKAQLVTFEFDSRQLRRWPSRDGRHWGH